MAKRYVDPDKTKIELELIRSKVNSLSYQYKSNQAKIDRLTKVNNDIKVKVGHLNDKAKKLQSLLGQ